MFTFPPVYVFAAMHVSVFRMVHVCVCAVFVSVSVCHAFCICVCPLCQSDNHYSCVSEVGFFCFVFCMLLSVSVCCFLCLPVSVTISVSVFCMLVNVSLCCVYMLCLCQYICVCVYFSVCV